MCSRRKLFGQFAHSLMMQAVDISGGNSQDICQASAVDNTYLMSQEIPGVMMIIVDHCAGELLREVLIEATTQSNIDYLATPANAQEGFTCLDERLNQVDLQPVALNAQPLHAGMRRVPIEARINITATGEQEAVQMREEGIKIITGKVQRDQQWQSSGCRN